MSFEEQKLHLIERIASLKDAQLILRLVQIIDDKQTSPNPSSSLRKAGFAKGTFPFVADDFDDTLPPGFEEYLLPALPDSPQ